MMKLLTTVVNRVFDLVTLLVVLYVGLLVAEYFLKTLRERERNAVDIIASGNIKSMEDYKYVMGELSAIRSLQQDLKETLQMDDIDG